MKLPKEINDPSEVLKSAKQLHLFWVYSDSKFIDAVNSLPQPPSIKNRTSGRWREPYEDLAKEYDINYLNVYLYKNHGMKALLVGAGLLPKGMAKFNAKEDVIELKLKKDVTQSDFYELWQEVRKAQKDEARLPATKQKYPQYHRLVYAINRSLSSGNDWGKIHDDYMNSKLAYFDGRPVERFYTVKGLRDYYNLYKPAD